MNNIKTTDIIYYQLEGGFIEKIRKIYSDWKIKQNEDKELLKKEPIITGITDYKKNNCNNILSPACEISDDTINKISEFLTMFLPKCKKIGLSLKDIKNGKILAVGTTGYTFKVKNKVIKIIVCDYAESPEKELYIHAKIMSSKFNNYFIRMFGYIMNDEKQIYRFYNIQQNPICKFIKQNIQNCILYVLMEAGEYDLEKFILNHIYQFPLINVLNNFFCKFTEAIYELVKFYKINTKFLEEKKIFMHCDIKLNNIIYVNNKLKIIDFGESKISETWENIINGTSLYKNYYFYNYRGQNNATPQYDIFSLIMCFIEFIFNIERKNLDDNIIRAKNDYITNINKCIKIINNINIMDDNILLKMYKLLCIGWIFYNNNDISFISVIINNKEIRPKTLLSIQEMYNCMDNIINSIYNCDTIEIIKNIKCNNQEFNSIIEN